MEVRVKIDADKLKIKDLKALETGDGLYDLIARVVDEAKVDGVVVETDDLPMSSLKQIAEGIGEAIKGLSDPNA